MHAAALLFLAAIVFGIHYSRPRAWMSVLAWPSDVGPIKHRVKKMTLDNSDNHCADNLAVRAGTESEITSSS